jgi:DNA polymerase-3 subunit delta
LSTISVRDLIARIRKGRLEKGYLFSGRDRDRKDETIAAVEDALKTSGDGTLSVIRIRSGETAPEELAAHLFNISLFDSCRLVIVPSADDLDGQARDILLEYARSPSTGVCLIACTRFGAREIGRRAPAVLGKLKAAMTLVDFPPPREGELRRRAAELAEGLGFRIEEDAVERLLAMTGEDPVAVRSEIEKLALFLPEGGTAGTAEVETVASRGGSLDVWALADAIGRRDAEQAQVVLHELLRSGERPVQIVGALWYSLVRMAWCRELLEEGADEMEIGRRLKLQPWAARRYRTGAIRFTREEYRRILEILFELDVALRSGGREVRPVFCRGVAEMVGGGAVAGGRATEGLR